MPKAGCLSGCWIDGSGLETVLAEQVLNLEVVPKGLVGGSDHCRVGGMCEGYQEAIPRIVNNRGATQVGEFPNAATPPAPTFIPRCWTCGGMSSVAVHLRPHSGITVDAFSTFSSSNTFSCLICITSLFWRDFPFHFKVRLLRLQEAQRLAGGP